MKNNLILRLVDSSSKECEVTGRMMGGDDVYEIPISGLKLGSVNWPQRGDPDHTVHVLSVGKDVVKVDVRTVSGHLDGPFELHVGDKKSSYYCFGEWSYGYTVSLICE